MGAAINVFSLSLTRSDPPGRTSQRNLSTRTDQPALPGNYSRCHGIDFWGSNAAAGAIGAFAADSAQ